MNTLILVVVIISIITIGFVYAIGRLHGSQAEKGKQNEQELELIKDAVKIRLNSNTDKLRKKYKTK